MQISYTTINHVARKELGISASEYMVADLIYNLSSNPKGSIQGWCYASKETMAEMLDIDSRTVFRAIDTLVTKGLVEKHPDTKHLRTTSLWYESVIIKPSDKMSYPATNSQKASDKMSVEDSDKMSYNKDINNKDIIINNDISQKILDYWNSKKLIAHRVLTDKIKRSINGRLNEKYTPGEITQAIDNYDFILKSPDYFWNYKWTLQDFLQRGFEKFRDLEIAKQNYKKGGFNNGGYQNPNRAQKGKYSNIPYEGGE